MTNALTTLKRSALPDSDLPVPAFPALSINPEKCKFDSGVAWKLRGLQISKPQIQSVAAYCVRLFGARPVISGPNNRRVCRNDDAQCFSTTHLAALMTEAPNLVAICTGLST